MSVIEYTWEYKSDLIEDKTYWQGGTCVDNIVEHLNTLGAEGWEVISMVEATKYGWERKGFRVTSKRRTGSKYLEAS